MSSMIPLYIIIPLGIAFLTIIFGRWLQCLGKYLIIPAMLFLTGLTFYFVLQAPQTLVYRVGGFADVLKIPAAIFLVADGLTNILLLIISLVGLLVALYSLSYTKQYSGEEKFYALFSLMLAGMYGVVLAGDIFNLYVFLEIASIASYALVAFGIEKEQLEATFKYQVLGGVSSLIILTAIGFIYWTTGTLNLADIATQLPDASSFQIFVSVLLIGGFGLKAALVPFHSWLPDAHSSAPSPISAMLSGVLIKAVGIYVIIRLFFSVFQMNYEIAMTITALGTLSMIVGVFLAVGQWDFKRLLAYHSISQMGYVVLGIGIGMLVLATGGKEKVAILAITGGLFHLLNHSIFKALLFLNAGSVEYRTGTRNLRKLGGLASKMPITSGSTFVASMAISGIPPFNGFFSKVVIIFAAIQAGYYWLAFSAVVVSIITLASFTKVLKYAFYGELPAKYENTKESPFSMSLSMTLLALLCLVMSLLIIPGVRAVFLQPAVDVLLETTKYSTKVIGL
ncbi:MAG: proton-conducting transporter membrane subunit [Candidatus Cloacimonadaceae bacterium]|nr:proton-conducting transporter membrane subunit [Candidatus Cloacimonadaceae bacterium]MDP3113431.1 proton-conducting transporter membrane subunit [Candidatus Cloacimonadaceae bacterium]